MACLFEKYVKCIQKQAHFYSKKWAVDYKELEAQGYLIYCDSLERWDATKSSFITFLTWRLHTLEDYCVAWFRHGGNLSCKRGSESELNNLSYVDEWEVSRQFLIDDARKYLSSSAFELFEWILSYKWRELKQNATKPSMNLASKYFHRSPEKTRHLWMEIRRYWIYRGRELYA